MELRKQRVAGCLLAALAAVLAGCSGGQPQSGARTVSPARGVSVRLPAGSAAVTATLAPQAAGPLTAPLMLDGRSVPSAIAVLAPPRRLALRGPFPPGGVVLSFRIRPGSVSPGTTPFLASLDLATGRWVPVVSTYDSATGTVSARVTHFSVWTVLDWLRSKIAAVLGGALSDIFGPIEAGSGVPACVGSSGVITISDSHPGGAIASCARAAGQAGVLAKVANLRRYPVDLLYPSGARISVSSADIFAQLGEDLNNLSSAWHDRVLLPGGTQADASLALAAGQSTALVTEMDTEAYLTAVLGTGLNVLAAMTGKLAESTAHILDLLAQGGCLRDLVRTAQHASLSPPAAENLGALGFECITAAAKLGAVGAVASLASIISSLASELIAGAWGIIDSAIGNGYHVLDLSRAAGQPWDSGDLTITPDSLGAVTTGMTIAQASAAAGVQLAPVGDGVFDPRGGTPHGLSVAGDPVGCVAVLQTPGVPVVATPQGFPLGGTLVQLKALYGSSLRFVPAPSGGITPNPGYVVSFPVGNLAFLVGNGTFFRKGSIYMIIGGPGAMPSTECA